MKPKKSQIKKLKLHLLEKGPGSKFVLAQEIGCAPSQITRLLDGGGISQDHWESILKLTLLK